MPELSSVASAQLIRLVTAGSIAPVGASLRTAPEPPVVLTTRLGPTFSAGEEEAC